MARSSDTNIVELDGVTKTFGNVTALDNLNMSIARGEFIIFLGPSGCGKSTTLRLLGGFEVPDRGHVVIDGQDVTSQPPNRRNVNMVFQDYALFPHMSVRTNIAFGLELKGRSRAQIDARVNELAAFLELGPYLDRRPDQLSGGQRQRAAVARALAPDPALLLLDEPLGALDAKLRTQVQQELKGIQRRTGKTFFFVTHDQDEALTMADRIVVMNHGRVEQDGTPEELYFHPASRFVAEFIGETNLIDARVKGTEPDHIVLDWKGMQLRGTGSPGHSVGEKVTASVRLEKLQLFNERPDTANAVRGRVVRQLFKGSRTTVEIAVADDSDDTLRAFVDTDTARSVGDAPVWIGWDCASLSVLRD